MYYYDRVEQKSTAKGRRVKRMNRLTQYIISKIGKFKHEINLEAHAYDRLYWMDLRQRGIKSDLEIELPQSP